MRAKAYRHDAQIQIYPTSKGWTIRARFRPGYPKSFQQKRWPVKESTVVDHKYTDLKHAVENAIAWLEEALVD